MSDVDSPNSKPTAAQLSQVRKEKEAVRKVKHAESMAALRAKSAERDAVRRAKYSEGVAARKASQAAAFAETRAAWAAIPKPGIRGAIRRAVNSLEGVEVNGDLIRYKGQAQLSPTLS